MQESNKEQEQEVQSVVGSFKERFNQMPPSRRLAMIGFAILMICVMIFIVFFTGGESSKPSKPKDNSTQVIEESPLPVNQPKQNIYSQKEKDETSAITKVSTKIAELKPPTPPSLEKIEDNTLKPLPVQPQQVSQPQLPLPISTTKKNDKTEANPKKPTNIIAFGGAKDEKGGDVKQSSKDEFLGFDGGMIDNAALKSSQAQPVVATKISNDLKYMIVQGKIIDAVLETAINTQMSSGVIRAVISRDVYGEQGDLVLIPKGSRLIGKYAASSGASGSGGGDSVITRVYASWNRIITPSGIDVTLPETPATDTLGRNGIPGYLDTNLSNNLFNAFLVSILGPYIVAEASGQGSKNVNSGNSDNNNSDNNDSSSLQVDLTTQILSQGIKDFQGIANDQINKIYPPGVVTNFVDQGTRIDIIVQQDILFPKQSIQLNTSNLP